MKFNICMALLSFSLFGNMQAQRGLDFTNKYLVVGKIVDSLSDQPVSYAAVEVTNTQSKKIAGGVITDSTGRFFIELSPGRFRISVSSVNHKNFKSDPFTLNTSSKIKSFRKLTLLSNMVLDQVDITIEKSLIENKIDRLVYNVDQDITNQGTSVTDMLRKVPMVEVDGDGNVSIRGSQKIKVFINGQPSAVVNGNITDALQSIPSDQVERVEVITNPSAKYDAEGSAGIINLVLKQSKLKGLNGGIRTGFGNRSAYFRGNLAFQNGKTGFSLNLGSYFWRNINETDMVRKNTIGTQNYEFRQSSEGTSFGGGPRLSLGIDHTFNDKNAISFSISSRGRLNNSDQNFSASSGLANTTLNYLYNRETDNRGFNYGYDMTLNYLKKYTKKGRELGIAVQYGASSQLSSYDAVQLDRTSPTYREKSDNNALNGEYTFQIDFTEPIRKWGIFETGVKTIVRRVNSKYSIDSLNSSTNNYQTIDALSTTFIYDQDVYAGYLQLQFNVTKKITMRLGTRYEYTMFGGRTEDENTNFTGEPYSNLIPYILINRVMGRAGFLKFGYSNRIQRPGLFFINPYQAQSDPRNLSTGNPELEAELAHNYELSYGKYGRKGGGMISAYFRQTNNAIESIRKVGSDGIYYTTYGNVGQSYYQGLDGNANINTKNLRLFLNGGVGYAIIQSTSDLSTLNGLQTEGITYSLGGGGSYQLPQRWEISGFARINAPSYNLQGYTTNWYFHTFGIKKRFKNKRGGIGLGFDNPFTPYVYYRTYNEGNDFTLDQKTKAYQLGIKVNFDYKFGSLKVEPKKKINFKKIDNADVKQGGGGSQGGE